MKIITFCGHRQVPQDEIKNWLENTVETLIKDGAEVFLLGGYGAFDELAAKTVWELKKKYPHIRSALVIPYRNRRFTLKYYDFAIYPPLGSVEDRYAIIERNRWMVREADTVVAYVVREGGAAKTLDYARRNKKEIIIYA